MTALTPHDVEQFEASRGRLEAIAYRLLGSAGDAEDAVQDTFLRWQAVDREQIETPAAWLTKVLTNLCLNQLASARVRRETYVGQWLPEPVLAGDPMLGPADTAEQRDQVSMAVLTMMERLSPNERVVYVLREAFGYPHAEIAAMLDISESNSQQLYRRAGQHLATDRVRTEIDSAAAERIVEEFIRAALSGDTEPLVRILTVDAVSVADGGGIVPARRTPLIGSLGIARLLRGVFTPNEARITMVRELIGGRADLYVIAANGEPALLVAVGDRVVGVITFRVTPEGVTNLHIQANPEKLQRVSRQWMAGGRGEPFATAW